MNMRMKHSTMITDMFTTNIISMSMSRMIQGSSPIPTHISMDR